MVAMTMTHAKKKKNSQHNNLLIVFVFRHFRSLHLYCAICRSCMIMWKMFLLQFSGQTMDINACRFCDWMHKDKPQNYGRSTQTLPLPRKEAKWKKTWNKEKLKGNYSKKRRAHRGNAKSAFHLHTSTNTSSKWKFSGKLMQHWRCKSLILNKRNKRISNMLKVFGDNSKNNNKTDCTQIQRKKTEEASVFVCVCRKKGQVKVLQVMDAPH